ncbi:MAG: rhodanese-like domain-containing protein [Candidatus Acidiferrales bacterium]
MLATITRDELKQKLDRHDALVLLDAPPESAFRKEHLPNVINLPSEEVRAHAPEILPDLKAEIVVYCGNAPCKRSDLATERLLDMGYSNVRDYHGSKKDWINAGLPIERGPAG